MSAHEADVAGSTRRPSIVHTSDTGTSDPFDATVRPVLTPVNHVRGRSHCAVTRASCRRSDDDPASGSSRLRHILGEPARTRRPVPSVGGMTTNLLRLRTPRPARRPAGALLGLLVAGVLLAGCSQDADSAVSPADDTVGGAVGGAVDGSAAHADEGGSGQDAGGEAAARDDARMVVQTGSVHVEAEDPIAAARAVADDVDRRGGRVESRSESAASADGTATAVLVVRVPATSVTATIEELGRIGEVTAVDLQADDVTGTAQDLDARIHALELSVQRMEALMSSAGTTKDLLEAESALSERQAELESLQSQRARLADQVALSTIEVVVSGPGVLPVQTQEEDGTFLTGLASGWEALVTTVGVVMVVLGALLPWLALAGVVALVVMAVRRRRRPAPAEPAAPEPVVVGARSGSDEGGVRPGDDG